MNGFKLDSDDTKLASSSDMMANSSLFTSSSSSSSSSSSCLSNSSSLSSSPKSQFNNASQYCDQMQFLQSNLIASLNNRLITAAANSIAPGQSGNGGDNASSIGESKSSPLSNEDYLDSSSISDDMDTSSQNNQMMMMMNSQGGESMSSCLGRANRFFPDNVVDILNKWFVENQEYPYPDEYMTNVLAKAANISAKQVRKWFANKRVRSNKCYKQTFRGKKEPKIRNHAVS